MFWQVRIHFNKKSIFREIFHWKLLILRGWMIPLEIFFKYNSNFWVMSIIARCHTHSTWKLLNGKNTLHLAKSFHDWRASLSWLSVSPYHPFILNPLIQKLSSGSMVLLTITFELRMILQNIWRRVVGNVLINISPSNILNKCFSLSPIHPLNPLILKSSSRNWCLDRWYFWR